MCLCLLVAYSRDVMGWDGAVYIYSYITVLLYNAIGGYPDSDDSDESGSDDGLDFLIQRGGGNYGAVRKVGHNANANISDDESDINEGGENSMDGVELGEVERPTSASSYSVESSSTVRLAKSEAGERPSSQRPPIKYPKVNYITGGKKNQGDVFAK